MVVLMEGYPEFKTSPTSKRNMGSSSPKRDHSYCRVPFQQTECDSRLGIKKQFRLLGMEANSPVISENLSTEGNPRDRSVCFQIISSYQNLLFVEAGSIEPSSRCLPIKLVPQCLCIFPQFCMIPMVLSKILKDEVPMMILVTPVWPSQMWYSEAMRMPIQQPTLMTCKERSLKKSKGKNLSPCPKQNFKISAMGCLRDSLQKEGISREASNIIIKSRRSNSNSNCESVWGKWAGWCAERKIDPFCSNINQILDFLSQLVQNGPQYRTINNYRSAISTFHDQI